VGACPDTSGRIQGVRHTNHGRYPASVCSSTMSVNTTPRGSSGQGRGITLPCAQGRGSVHHLRRSNAGLRMWERRARHAIAPTGLVRIQTGREHSRRNRPAFVGKAATKEFAPRDFAGGSGCYVPGGIATTDARRKRILVPAPCSHHQHNQSRHQDDRESEHGPDEVVAHCGGLGGDVYG